MLFLGLGLMRFQRSLAEKAKNRQTQLEPGMEQAALQHALKEPLGGILFSCLPPRVPPNFRPTVTRVHNLYQRMFLSWIPRAPVPQSQQLLALRE